MVTENGSNMFYQNNSTANFKMDCASDSIQMRHEAARTKPFQPQDKDTVKWN